MPAGHDARCRRSIASAEIETRYGGRFVQSIDGIEGSHREPARLVLLRERLEADRSAAEYRLRAGDIEWWDYRSWRTRMREPVVVGAFPEPFVHGYGGERRRPCRRTRRGAASRAHRARRDVRRSASAAPRRGRERPSPRAGHAAASAPRSERRRVAGDASCSSTTCQAPAARALCSAAYRYASVAVSPAPAAALLAALAAAALLADRIVLGRGDRRRCCSPSACARRPARRCRTSSGRSSRRSSCSS